MTVSLWLGYPWEPRSQKYQWLMSLKFLKTYKALVHDLRHLVIEWTIQLFSYLVEQNIVLVRLFQFEPVQRPLKSFVREYLQICHLTDKAIKKSSKSRGRLLTFNGLSIRKVEKNKTDILNMPSLVEGLKTVHNLIQKDCKKTKMADLNKIQKLFVLIREFLMYHCVVWLVQIHILTNCSFLTQRKSGQKTSATKHQYITRNQWRTAMSICLLQSTTSVKMVLLGCDRHSFQVNHNGLVSLFFLI